MSSKPKTSSSSIWDKVPSLLNVLCAIVLGIALTHHYILDGSTCASLLKDGHWLDESKLKSWQPLGSILHHYNTKEASQCLDRKRIVFVGDSLIRQTFYAVARVLDPKIKTDEAKRHSDIKFEPRKDLTVEFYWDPYLNSSGIKSTTSAHSKLDRPAITFIGSGLWYGYLEDEPQKKWKENIKQVVDTLSAGGLLKPSPNNDAIIISPVQEPIWEALEPRRKDALSRIDVKDMNAYLKQLSISRGFILASVFNELASVPNAKLDDGLHDVDAITAAQADILLNYRCNQAVQAGYPYKRTSCYSYPTINFFQAGFFLFIFALVPIGIKVLPQMGASNIFYQLMPAHHFLKAFFVFGCVITYCFLADRTQIFGKEGKLYSNLEFFTLSGVALFVGFATLKKSEKDVPFLFRDQTDEWKGWMQIAILIYHYTGGSKVAWIYSMIRVLVAAYLFMTGYGHTIFFVKKGDFGFKRIASVMVRLNLLNCALAYSMNTDYLFYYFSPLVSFWFFVIWITFWAGNKYNQNLTFLLAKIFISAGLIWAFINLPGPLDFVFDVLKFTCKIEWNLNEWRFRVALDQWIVYVGMLVGVAFIQISDNKLTSSAWWPKALTYSIILSLIALPVFFWFEATRENKFVYNDWHPYVSAFPILAFIVLRNATASIRKAHSVAFAWVGKVSLETFILQFHIWLAADTQGLLTFWPTKIRVINFLFLTPIFLYMSHLTSAATGELTEWLMGAEKKKPRAPPAALPTSQPAADGSTFANGLAHASSSAGVPEAVPLNAQQVQLNTNSNGNSGVMEAMDIMEKQGPNSRKNMADQLGSALEKVRKDLRFRLGLFLLASFILNWVY